MKKYSKGTTLIEIMISVLLISFIMVFLFNILINMKEEYNLTAKKSEDSLNRSSYTRIIQNDLIENQVVGVTKCNTGNICLTLKLKNSAGTTVNKTLSIYEKSIVYDGELWELVGGKYDISNAVFNYSVAETDPNKLSQPNVVNYHLLKFIVPVKHDVFSNRKLDFELVNIGKEVISLNCDDIGNYLSSKGVDLNNFYCGN